MKVYFDFDYDYDYFIISNSCFMFSNFRFKQGHFVILFCIRLVNLKFFNKFMKVNVNNGSCFTLSLLSLSSIIFFGEITSNLSRIFFSFSISLFLYFSRIIRLVREFLYFFYQLMIFHNSIRKYCFFLFLTFYPFLSILPYLLCFVIFWS